MSFASDHGPTRSPFAKIRRAEDASPTDEPAVDNQLDTCAEGHLIALEFLGLRCFEWATNVDLSIDGLGDRIAELAHGMGESKLNAESSEAATAYTF